MNEDLRVTAGASSSVRVRRSAPTRAIAFALPLLLTGCPALLSDWTIGGRGTGDASADGAATETGVSGSSAGGSSGASGGSGGAMGSGGLAAGGSSGSSSGGTDAAPAPKEAGTSHDAMPDAPPRECVTDLSGVGTGDFRISFTLTTTEAVLTLALLNQRTGCDETSTYWDVSLSPTGGVVAVTNDGTHRVFVAAGNSLNDGKPHKVDVIRRDGLLWYASDGTISSNQAPNPFSFGTFPPLTLGLSACAGTTPAAGHATISDVCISTSGGDAGTCDAGAGLQTNPSNCGRCGHDCQGGTCSAGVCQPVTLATGQTLPWGIAVDATSVYWATNTNPGTVMKAPLAGGTTMTLASGQNSPSGIAVDATNVYWTNGAGADSVMKVPIGGGTAMTLASGQLYQSAIAIDSTSVYWANYGNGTVMKVPIVGGVATTLASGQAAPYAIAVDATSVYWTTYATAGPSLPAAGTVMKAPVGGGSPTTLASGENGPNSVAVDATSVYWSSGPGGVVMKVPLDGGSPITLASGQSPNGIAVDTASVYWTNNGDGTVMTVPVGGGSPTVLASGQSRPIGIAVDATSVYWVNSVSPGAVMKVAKP